MPPTLLKKLGTFWKAQCCAVATSRHLIYKLKGKNTSTRNELVLAYRVGSD